MFHQKSHSVTQFLGELFILLIISETPSTACPRKISVGRVYHVKFQSLIWSHDDTCHSSYISPALLGFGHLNPGGEGCLLLTSNSKRNFHNIKCPILPSRELTYPTKREVQKIIDSKVPAIGSGTRVEFPWRVLLFLPYFPLHIMKDSSMNLYSFPVLSLGLLRILSKNQGPKSYIPYIFMI